MPTYPIKNMKTGETKELLMSMKEYDQWRKDNPDWDKDWSQGAQVQSVVLETYTVEQMEDGMKSYQGYQRCLGSKVKPQKTTHF